MPHGYNGTALHIDLTTRTTQVESFDELWYRRYVGGGLAGAYLLLRDTPAGIDAYDPENLLIFASSVVAGADGPGLARFSVICKSPLSGGIAETRCEGPFGRWLKGSGHDFVVVHGAASEPCVVVLEDGRAEFCSAGDLWGMNTSAATSELERRFGSSRTEDSTQSGVQVATIGRAGEHLVRYASIVTSYSIQAMRMGTGAVMGAKKLKALVLRDCTVPPPHDSTALAALRSEFAEKMEANTLSMWQKEPPGFSASADLSDFDTAYIGVNNYQSNLRVEDSNYTRAKYLEHYRGAIPCPGCANDCIKIIDPRPDETEGHPASAGIHQEVTGSLGPNIGNGDLELMLEANVLCNEYGLDPVSLGFTISFAMEAFEAGLIGTVDTNGYELRFGNVEVVKPLIEDIAERVGFGSLLAEGSHHAAGQIGGQSPERAQEFALTVKGVEMVSFEPRTQTNLALGYATAPIGPRYDICEHDWDFDTVSGWEHTLDYSRALGIHERIPMEYLGPDKVRNYKVLNTVWSACDALDLCVFASAPTRVLSMEMIPRLIEAVTGWQTSSYEFMRWGERRNHIMRVYNLREGLGKSDDTLPERFFTTPIDHGRLRGSVIDRDRFAAAVETYYGMMGWDERGVPTPATLYEHQLEWAISILREIQ